MVGVVLILIVMFVAGPIGVFAAGAIWSAINGWLQSDAADERAEATDPAAA